MLKFLHFVIISSIFSNFVYRNNNFQNNFYSLSYWSIVSQTCMACPNGFSTNYFFATNDLTGYNSLYYNPYTCYQVQPSTTSFYLARSNCASKGTGYTTMIMRTTNEYRDSQRFYTLFGGNYWVTFTFDKFLNFIYLFVLKNS